MFASLIRKTKFSIDFSPSLKLNRIRFLHQLFSLKEVIAFVNSFYDAQVIDIAALYDNTHLKHFDSCDTKGPAKVPVPTAIPVPAFPFLYLKVPNVPWLRKMSIFSLVVL